MKRTNESELEDFFRNETRKMPGWKAPSGLSSRVISAIEAKARLPWWKQSFWAWPIVVQVAAITVLSCVSAFIIYLGWIAPATVTSTAVWNEWSYFLDRFGQVWNAIRILANAFNLAMKTSLQFWLIMAFLVSCFMCLFCLGAGSLVAHMAWKRTR